jgi:hypothetical protein
MSDVRVIFDAMLSKYSEMERHISQHGRIFHWPNFETGLVKLQLKNGKAYQVKKVNLCVLFYQ